MMAFAGMLIGAAQEAGMTIPDDPDDFHSDEFPHFHVFCAVQLGRWMEIGEHWENAKIIAAIPEEEIRTIRLYELIEKGLSWST